MEKVIYNKKGQAMPAGTIPVKQEAFGKLDHTEVTWLGNAGVLLNVRGTTMLIDPLLMGFDMPLLFDIPLTPEGVPELSAYLVTHIDNDHFSRETVEALRDRCGAFHASHYVASEMEALGVRAYGHDIGEPFYADDVKIIPTPAKHNWQNGIPEYDFREWKEEDYCGFFFETPDGIIWLPGDSKLLESHLHMPEPIMILFDFSDNDWHITFDGAVRMADTYPNARLLCIHWGTVDSPEMTPFNGDPNRLKKAVVNPERVLTPLPGEGVVL